MISFNFFKKKKDDGFSLDDYSLPSLNEENSAELDSTQDPQTSAPSLSPLSGSVDSTENLSPTNTFSPALGAISPSSEMPLSQNEQNPFSNPLSVSNLPSNESSSRNNELIETKLSHIETKLSLMEARAQSAESKLDLMYEMLLSEVSEETKKKLKVKSMMNLIKNE